MMRREAAAMAVGVEILLMRKKRSKTSLRKTSKLNFLAMLDKISIASSLLLEFILITQRNAVVYFTACF
jgi:hypothetical protein